MWNEPVTSTVLPNARPRSSASPSSGTTSLESDSAAVVTKEDVAPQIDGFLKAYRELLPIEDWNLKSVELASKGKKKS